MSECDCEASIMMRSRSTGGEGGLLHNGEKMEHILIYLLTAIGLSPGGSSTVHI